MSRTSTHGGTIHEPYRPLAIEYLAMQAGFSNIRPRTWCNNLVASCKRQNYVFVAFRSVIHVYIPMHPWQRLPTKPYAILKSSTMAAVPFELGDEFHGINSLTVGELGSEEVLVSAHRDGDVVVWYTKELKLMLHYNVGSSAWGVAMHKERRLLAVSANSWKITVFELAVGEDREENGFESDGEEEGDIDACADKRKSSRNGNLNDTEMLRNKERRTDDAVVKCKILQGGSTHNIPNVTFLDDENGQWLVSASIDGTVVLWDIHSQSVVETCKFDGGMRRGWSVVYLTPQSFKPVNSMYEALGKSPMDSPRRKGVHLEDLPPKVRIPWMTKITTGYNGNSVPSAITGCDAWDITPRLQSIYSGFWGDGPAPAWGSVHINEGDEDSDAGSEDELEYDNGYDDDDDASAEQSEDEGDDEEEEDEEGQEETASPPLFTPEAQAENASESEELEEEDADEMEGVEETDWPVISQGSGETTIDGEEGEGEELTPMGPIFSPAASPRFSGSGHISPPKAPKPAIEAARPPLGFLFTTTACSAALFPTGSLSPIVVCKRPACQAPPPTMSHRHLGHFDRLNMVIPVPELSLVVAASQQGRASIFRLTRCGENYAMRLDTVLPRERGTVLLPGEEMDVQVRPNAPLMGITMSPVQGQEVEIGRCGRKERSRGGGWRGIEAGRRWRLLMVYVDNTVLSYELGRQNESTVGRPLERKVCMV